MTDLDSQHPFFSIIIPIYNGGRFVERLIANLKKQGLKKPDFEVIYVDDASTDDTVEHICHACANNPDIDIKLIRHEYNKRQGGARNTGVEHSNGKYIIFIDADDYLRDGALAKIKDALCIQESEPLDLLMYDFVWIKGESILEPVYPHNNQKILDGIDFIKQNELNWAPWGYAYRKGFLTEANLRYREKVQFEDADFQIEAVSKAKRIQYKPIIGVVYELNDDSTTNFHRTSVKNIEEMNQGAQRMREISKKLESIDEEVANVIKQHYRVAYKANTFRLIHLRSLRERRYLINKYYKGIFDHTDGRYLQFASKHPDIFAFVIHLNAPILRYLHKRKRKKIYQK